MFFGRLQRVLLFQVLLLRFGTLHRRSSARTSISCSQGLVWCERRARGRPGWSAASLEATEFSESPPTPWVKTCRLMLVSGPLKRRCWCQWALESEERNPPPREQEHTRA